HARELREAEDLLAWDVADGDGAEERQQVVLTERVELYGLQHHHLRALGLEQRTVDDVLDRDVVAAGEEAQGPLDALGRLHQPFALNVLTQAGDERAYVARQARLADLVERL